MNKNFLDELVNFNEINPEDIFNGFYEKFAIIEQMEVNELIVAKQSIDLALKFSCDLSDEQENILLHLVSAMQQKAAFCCHPSFGEERILRKLFCLHDCGLHHPIELFLDRERKILVPQSEFKPVINDMPTKKKFFGIL